MKIRWSWMMFFPLMMPVWSYAQSPRENAALVHPRLPRQIPRNEGRILISTLEEQLSTRFNLLARSRVDQAYKDAVASLPGEECTEENCLLKMQEFLSINLIFTFGVLQSEMTTLLTLQLQEGPKKIVKNEICNAPCGIESKMKGVVTLVQKLLVERDRGRMPLVRDEPGLNVKPGELKLEEGGGPGRILVRLKAPPQGTLNVGADLLPQGMLVLEPPQRSFDGENWNREQEFLLYARNNEKMDGDREASVRFRITESQDMNYAFVEPVETRVRISDDDVKGELTLLSRPPGAAVEIDGKVLLDVDRQPVVTPAELQLERGRHRIRLSMAGHRPESFSILVKQLRLGTRMVQLNPQGATLSLEVPQRYASGEVMVDGRKRFSFRGASRIQREFPPGIYSLQVITRDAVSELKTVNLRSGRSNRVRFEDFSLRESFWEQSKKSLGLNESYLGPHVEMLLTRSGGFPLKHVNWNLPGISWGVRGPRQVLELQASQGAGATETFTASDSGTDHYIESVQVQRFGLSYGYRMFNPIQLNLGLSSTQLEFGSSSKTFEYNYPAAFAGVGWDTRLAGWRLDASGRLNHRGQTTLQAGMRYRF